MTSITMKPAVSLGDLISRIAPKRALRDPLGFFGGYRAYQVYTHLAARSDAELADLGLSRSDLPRVAFAAMTAN